MVNLRSGGALWLSLYSQITSTKSFGIFPFNKASLLPCAWPVLLVLTVRKMEELALEEELGSHTCISPADHQLTR